MLSKVGFSLALVVFAFQSSFAQFTTRQVSSSRLDAIYMVNASTGYVGGVEGIFKTTNSGLNWTRLPYFVSAANSPDGLFFTSMVSSRIHFLDENVGYAVGFGALGNYEQIIKTTDGGATWQLQHVVNPDNAPFQAPEPRLQDIHAFNANTLLTIGYRGRILKTSNGGTNWAVINSTTSSNLLSVAFKNATEGIIGGEGVILRTNDGGDSWVSESSIYSFKDITYLTDQELIAVTESKVVKSYDGGQTWSAIEVPTMIGFSRLSFINSTTGFIGGNNVLLKTTNAGATFEKQYMSSFNVSGIHAFPAEQIFLSSEQGKVSSTATPITWFPISKFSLSMQSICANQELTATNESYTGYAYAWYVDDVLVSSSYHLKHSFTTPGSHAIKLKVGTGSKTDSYTQYVTVKDIPALPSFKLMADKTSICKGDPIYFWVQSSSTETFTLYDAANNSLGAVNWWQPFYFNTTSTVHIKKEVTHECGTRSGVDSLRIVVVPKPSASVQAVASKTSVCLGEASSIDMLNSEIGMTYTMEEPHDPWVNNYFKVSAPGNGGTLKFNVPAITKTVEYDIIGKNSIGCYMNYGRFKFTVRNFGVDFSVHSIFEIQNSSVNFTNKSTADSYVWTFGDGASATTSTQANPAITFSTAGDKTITLTGTVQEGCSKTVQKKFKVVPSVAAQQMTAYSHVPLAGLDSTHLITGFKKIGQHIYIIGYIRYHKLTYEQERARMFVAKYKEDGTQLWMLKRSEAVTTESTSVANNLAIDANENIYVTGCFKGGTLSIGNKIFNSRRTNHTYETRSILMKIDKDGKIIWGNIFELSEQTPNNDYGSMYLTDVLVSKDILYLYLITYKRDPVMISRDETYTLTLPEYNYRDGVIFMTDTAGHYKRIINNITFGYGTSSHYIRRPDKNVPGYSVIDGVNGYHTPGLHLQGDTLGVFTAARVLGNGPINTFNYISQSSYRISNTSLGNVLTAVKYPFIQGYSTMGVYNWRYTASDPMTGRYYDVISFKDFYKNSAGISIVGQDTLNVVDGSILMCRDKNSNLLWHKYLPYGDIINVKLINSDVYVFGNFEDWMGIEDGSRTYKGIKGNPNSAFVAKFNSRGQVESLSDLKLPDYGKNVMFAMDANDCTNDFTLLGVGSNGYYLRSYSLDSDVSTQCMEVLFKASERDVLAGESVNFADISVPNPDQWEWNFEGAETTTSSAASPQGIIYKTPGTYAVSLTIHSGGRTETRVVQDYITVHPSLIADFMANETEIVAGNSIIFSDRSVGAPSQWEWTFDGGSPYTRTTQNAITTYFTPGKFKVLLTVKRTGHSNTKNVVDYVTVHEAINLNVAVSGSTCGLGQPVNFNANTTGNPTSFEWTFEGGIPSSSQSQNPVVAYTNPGHYKATLTVKGNIQTKTWEGYITVQPMTAAFSINKNEIVVNESVTLTDLSTGFPDNWKWNMEGGTPATMESKNATVAYTMPGLYTVSLTTSRGAVADKLTIPNLIRVHQVIIPDFSADKTAISVGEAINFQNHSSGGIETYEWNFPGGFPATSSSQNPPEIVYPQAGVYNVSLKVKGDIQSKTAEKTKFINVSVITASEDDLNAEIVLYPNPSKGRFMVKTSKKLCRADLYSNLGELLETVNVADNEIKFHPKPGLYFVKILTADGNAYLQKVVIE